MPTPPRYPRLLSGVSAPVDTDLSRSRVGDLAPPHMQEWQLIEKLTHLNRDQIPVRAVHAKGWGAYGVLNITGDISHLTCARVLQPGAETPMVARFSNLCGELGSADHERGLRGFALRFHTPDGNWDLVGNNMPVFFVRDPHRFPDFIQTQKRHPRTNLRSAIAMWDFWSQSQESLHLLTMLFSDRGLPVSPMHMNGYGGHTYSLWNEQGEPVWIKFHFKTRQGHCHYTSAEAEEIVGQTRDGYEEALSDAIESGEFPRWDMQVQIMTLEQANDLLFDPFDLTRVWPHAEFCPIDIGVLEINRNPDNYLSEIDHLAFSPSNVVRGIGHSPDRMLQARIFSYADAHRHRLGPSYAALPANRPHGPMHHDHKDGAMRFLDNVAKLSACDKPESLFIPNGSEPFSEPPFDQHRSVARLDQRDVSDDFSQPRRLFLLFDEAQRARLFANIATSMKGVPADITERQIDLFRQVHPDFGIGVCAAVDAMDPQF